jgi:hypothetical protein
MRRRSLPLLLLALAALALGACGNKEERKLHGATEGVYLDVGELKYQVQISRLLNPNDPEDKDYLVDLPAGQGLARGEQWFAVFIRVENETSSAHRAADGYSIKDTQDNVYRPVQLGDKNVFAYRPGDVPPNEVIPLADSAGGQNSIQGALLLFKVPTRNFENRPLELRISSADVPNEVGTVDLDV